MKSAILLIASVFAQSQGGDPISVKFPNDCAGGVCATGSCCKLTDNTANILEKCMTEADTAGKLTGKYEDDQFTTFSWTCPEATEEGSSLLKYSVATAFAGAMYMM